MVDSESGGVCGANPRRAPVTGFGDAETRALADPRAVPYRPRAQVAPDPVGRRTAIATAM